MLPIKMDGEVAIWVEGSLALHDNHHHFNPLGIWIILLLIPGPIKSISTVVICSDGIRRKRFQIVKTYIPDMSLGTCEVR